MVLQRTGKLGQTWRSLASDWPASDVRATRQRAGARRLHLQPRQIGNVAILTGDIHSSWGNDIVPNPFNPSAYDPTTGKGSLAVEFVTPAVTSPGIGDPAQAALLAAVLRQTHPHIKFVELSRRGYALLDVTPARIQCEWYHVATIDSRSPAETLAAMLQVKDGENHLRPSTEATLPRAGAAFAPEAVDGRAKA
jgi:alkaline phosphatase D